ncbi:ferredoxin [Streptomyces griseoaurantiacus]|nr:ferredoxin [Streptomyces griseoaurantiacus]
MRVPPHTHTHARAPAPPPRRWFGAGGPGYPHRVTTTTSQTTTQEELFRFLEDRFGCAQTCAECARACALRASLVDPGGPADQEAVRRKGIMCAEVCDATCRVLSEQGSQDEAALRVQVEWCRAVCLESAHVFDAHPGAEDTAKVCRECAQACTDFMTTLA